MSFSSQGLDHDLPYTCITTCRQNHSGFANETAQNTASSCYSFSAFSLKAFLEPLIMRKDKKSKTWLLSGESLLLLNAQLTKLLADCYSSAAAMGRNISKGCFSQSATRHSSQQTQCSILSYSLAFILSFVFSSSCNTGLLSGNQLHSW